MPLEVFADAEGREGVLYELGRGVVSVNQVHNYRHLLTINAIFRQLSAFDIANPGVIFCIASGGDCKIPLAKLESERHPDLTIYKTPPPANVEGRDVWSMWIPELVVEVVSPESGDRDYNQKPEEYLQFGISEYWIIDPERQLLTVLQRSGGQWKEHKIAPGESHTTHILPGFVFDLQRVFDAANE